MSANDAHLPRDDRGILLDVAVKDKYELFSLMVARLVETGFVKDRDSVLQALLDREEARPTGLARGVACPHAKCDFVEATCTVIARLSKAVDFGAQDGLPARHVFMIVSPRSADGNPHIAALASVVRCYQNPELLAELDASRTARDYLQALTSCNER